MRGSQSLSLQTRKGSSWYTHGRLRPFSSEDQAIALAVEQIDLVHPETDTKALIQVAKRQAWASDPTTLGAFVHLRPKEYISVMFLMQDSLALLEKLCDEVASSWVIVLEEGVME